MAEKRRLTVGQFCEVMEGIVAPTWAAAEWDNVGLLVGGRAWPATRAMLAIDLTSAVLAEAKRGTCDLIVAYHPPVFRPVNRMTVDPQRQEGIAAEALASGIAVYSPHTALDAAPGGTNETLAEMSGLEDVMPFVPAGRGEKQCKLVVFVPETHLDGVAEAVFAAGGGRIGDYEKCSYRLRGEGTFFGTEATAPRVGQKGRLETVAEVRLEVVVPQRRVMDVARAIRRSHPYEEPAFDVYPVEDVPDGRTGQGRIGRFRRAVTLQSLARSLKKKLRAEQVAMVGKAGQTLRRGFVCVGAAGSLPFETAEGPCGPGDVVITGEIRHHDALRFERAGAAAIALGHWTSERPALGPLSRTLRRLLPRLDVVISRSDREPFRRVS